MFVDNYGLASSRFIPTSFLLDCEEGRRLRAVLVGRRDMEREYKSRAGADIVELRVPTSG